MLVAIAALGLAACSNFADQTVGNLDPIKLPNKVNSFDVTVTSVTRADGAPLTGGDGISEETAWPFPFGKVKIHVQAKAIKLDKTVDADANRVVSVQVTPGDIDPTTRTMQLVKGEGEVDIIAAHVYGRVTVVVRDTPAKEAYDANGDPVAPTPPSDPDAPYTGNSGVSQVLYFQRPEIVDLQRQPGCDPSKSFSTSIASCTTDDDCVDCSGRQCDRYLCYQNACMSACDNRVSPLTGDFVEVDEPYTSLDAGMIVTAITSSGFYVSDLSAQKFSDPSKPDYTATWQALPGTFNSLFVYTYSAPNDLYVGDHIISLTGSVQEFSGDTQLDFPGWVKVDLTDEEAQQSLAYIPQPWPIDLSLCGTDDSHSRTAQDLCGYFNDGTPGMSLESLESAPVVVDHITPSNIFVNCDRNGDGTLPLFANNSNTWKCFDDDPNLSECACYIACATGHPQLGLDGGVVDYSHYDDSIPGVCSELSTYETYGQWEAVMPDQLGADGGIAIHSNGTRINVQTGDALPGFNPLDLAKPEYQGVTFRVSGMLSQVQASRPRWLIYARDPSDVCCYPATYPDGGGSGCPNGVSSCEPLAGE